MTSIDTVALAELLYPHVTQTPADWLAKYPARTLPDGARVTRFAPSPTGFVHIGGILAALVSRRVAHQSGGVFFLRIEDTDKKREQDGAVEEIVRNLLNFGLGPDEGVVAIDPEQEKGEYAPYTQSERVDIYESFAKDLVARGLAYPSFDSEDELDRNRKLQEAQKVKPGYYGRYARWRDANMSDIQMEIDKGIKPVIRIRAPYPNETRARFQDGVKGDLDLPANDQDTVLIKSNRLPTYHFAHVIDDLLMRVNMVIRGDEWLPSAPLHLQVYEAIGQPTPTMAHIAPIAKMEGASKRKLSKRKDPEANVTWFYEAGYPKQAVTEYLLNLANSDFYDWRKANPTAPDSDFQLRLENMGVSSALFDLVKLNDISKDIVATYSAETLYQAALEWACQYDTELAAVIAADPEYSIRVFNVERSGDAPRKDIVNFSDVRRACGFFFDTIYDSIIAADGYTFGKVVGEDVIAILDEVKRFAVGTEKDSWLETMRAFAEGISFARDNKTYKKTPDAYKGHFGDMMMVVRVALTGKTQTPDLYEMITTMGMARVTLRLDRAIASVGTPAPQNNP